MLPYLVIHFMNGGPVAHVIGLVVDQSLCSSPPSGATQPIVCNLHIISQWFLRDNEADWGRTMVIVQTNNVDSVFSE